MNPRTLDLMRRIVEPLKYTFWCHDKQADTVFDMGLRAPYAETKACRDDVAKVNPERYEYGPPQIAGTPAHDFTKRLHKHIVAALPATPPAAGSNMCCLPWCIRAASKHTSERTERCLDYAVKKEIIEKRLSIFSSVVKVSSEIEWATKKTAEELETLERQWRSLDPDRVEGVS